MMTLSNKTKKLKERNTIELLTDNYLCRVILKKMRQQENIYLKDAIVCDKTLAKIDDAAVLLARYNKRRQRMGKAFGIAFL